MSGPASNQRLDALQGADFSETFLFFNPPSSGSKDVSDLVPVDFTGATARMMVKPTSDSTAVAILSLAIGTGLEWTAATTTPGPALPAYNNGLVVTITKAQLLAAAAGTFYYDLLVDWASGTTAILARGTFTIEATATR
jgi:hypothetical protein